MYEIANQERSPVVIPNFPLYGKDKNGDRKLRGTSFRFGSDKETAHSASDLKKMLKEQGVKTSLIRKQVNSVLQGKVEVSFLQAQAFMAGMRAEGFIPDKGDKTARSASLRFVKIGSAAPVRSEKAIREAAVNEVLAKLRDLGLDEATIASLQK